MAWSFYNSSGKLIDGVLDSSITGAKIAANTITGDKIALGSDAQGDVMYYNGTDWVRLGFGTSGYFLKTQGTGANPLWAAAGSNISVRAISSGTQSLTDNQYEEVILNGTDAFDVTNMHDPSTNNTRITFATAGTYLLVGHVTFAPHATGIRNVEFRANGSTRFDQVQDNNPSSGEETKMVNTAIYTFAATNYVELRAKQNCGSGLNINTCEFSAIKILG